MDLESSLEFKDSVIFDSSNKAGDGGQAGVIRENKVVTVFHSTRGNSESQPHGIENFHLDKDC